MSHTTHRRGFLGRLAAAAVATSLPWTVRASTEIAQTTEPGPDDWLSGLTGTYRCLFDFPRHEEGLPLTHMGAYIRTYSRAFGVGESDVNAIGTFYLNRPAASIPLAFNDEMWERFRFGEYMGITDPKTEQPTVRNMFNRPEPGDRKGPGIENLRAWARRFCFATMR